MHTHILDIIQVLEYENLSKVTLVGHSYGGLVIGGVAAKVPERIIRLVYLDAYIPQDSKSAFEDKNMVFAIKGKPSDRKISFHYKTKGVMALIGKRNGVGILLGHKVHGFAAWFLWRLYYLGNLPTVEKKLRVTVDWTIDLFFKRDVSRLRTFTEESSVKASTQILR